MKRFFAILLSATLLCTLFAGCGKTENSPIGNTPSENSVEISKSSENNTESSKPSEDSAESSKPDSTPHNTSEDTMYIIIGEHTLTVKMVENSSAEALITLLKDGDITVNAHDYGSFEKVGSLGKKLPTNNKQITTEPGDVILYQGNQITVYYDTNSWSFTQLGKVQGMTADELKAILGDGDVTMVLSLNDPNSTESE